MEKDVIFETAERYVRSTGKSIFLTGRAGTGKTTFLKYVAESISKRYVILAPTGVAAINAGGTTIHSFFPAATVSLSARCQGADNGVSAAREVS